MKNINLILGLTASIALTGLPNTVLGHEILDCKHCEKKIISNLDLRTPETIEGRPIENIVLEEKNKSLLADPEIVEYEKNKAIEEEKRAYPPHRETGSNFKLSFHERLQLPPIDQNFINDAAVIF